MSDTCLLCPYCMTRVHDLAGTCPACREDMSRDAGFELTPGQYEDEDRVACAHCGQEKLRLALLCPACRRRRDGSYGMDSLAAPAPEGSARLRFALEIGGYPREDGPREELLGLVRALQARIRPIVGARPGDGELESDILGADEGERVSLYTPDSVRLPGGREELERHRRELEAAAQARFGPGVRVTIERV